MEKQENHLHFVSVLIRMPKSVRLIFMSAVMFILRHRQALAPKSIRKILQSNIKVETVRLVSQRRIVLFGKQDHMLIGFQSRQQVEVEKVVLFTKLLHMTKFLLARVL